MPVMQSPSPLVNVLAASTYNANWFSGAGKEAQISAAIAAAAADGAGFVYVPANLLPYIASQVTFNTSVKMIREGGDANTYDVRAYGAAGDNSQDDTAAITAAITAAQAYIAAQETAGFSGGAKVWIPAGTYLVTDRIAVSKNRVYIVGDGINATLINFVPTKAETLFNVKRTTLADIAQGGINGLTVTSASTSFKKIAFALFAVSGYVLENVEVTGAGFVSGLGDTALYLSGHESSTVRSVIFAADQPIYIAGNSVTPSISLDHFHFTDIYLLGTSLKPLIEVATGTYLTNITFDGYQAWVGGTTGFYWLDTTSAGISTNLVFRNVRWEQCSTPTGNFLIRIDHNAGGNVQGVLVDNCYGGLDRTKGFRFRNCQTVTFLNMTYTGTGEALNVDATVAGITISGCYWQSTSTATMTGQRVVFASPLNPNTGALPPNAIYDLTTNTLTEISVSGLRIQGPATARAGTDFILGNVDQATIGAAGGAAALPATPLGYAIAYKGTTKVAIPYYTPA